MRPFPWARNLPALEFRVTRDPFSAKRLIFASASDEPFLISTAKSVLAGIADRFMLAAPELSHTKQEPSLSAEPAIVMTNFAIDSLFDIG
jgi:hypothetical protein